MSDTGRRLAELNAWYTRTVGRVLPVDALKPEAKDRLSAEIFANVVALLTAWEHLHGNSGQSELELQRYIATAHTEAGLPPIGANARQA